MAWTHYESVTWFVQGSSSDDPGTQGSAVAVRVLRQGESDPKTYLLTCAHVVRSSDPDSDPGQGAGPVHKTIRAWRSGSGRTDKEARPVCVIASAHRKHDEPIPENQRTPSFDWALLEIENADEANAAPTVPFWAGPEPQGQFLVCGYPGEEPFTRDVVKPTNSKRDLIPYDSDLGVLRLTGDETRAGMSGGGLFDSDGLLVGIHRSKRDAELKLVALSADYIRQQLKEKGFYVVVDEFPDDSTPVGEFAKLLLGAAFRGVDLREPLNRWLPRASVHFKLQNHRDDDALVASLRELGRLGRNESGVLPLHGFAHDVNGLKTGDVLGEWIRKHFPNEGPVQLKEPEAPKCEPRIVVEMIPQGPPCKVPERRSIEYKIWFVGFRRSPPARLLVDELGRFAAVIESAWDEVRGQADSKRTWVELFLPKELLAWKFEEKVIRIGKMRTKIGSTHPFALRLMGREDPLRLDDEEFDRSLSLHRYGSFDLIPKACGSHVLVEAPGDSDPTDLYTALQGKENVLGVLWTSHPRTAENTAKKDLDVWDAVSQAGIPLVVWLREIPEARPDLGAKFHDKTWDKLAGIVKDLRNEGALNSGSWHFGQHLAVILDDDRRLHPKSIPFHSPH